MVSSDFGKLEVSRHLISGEACAIAGAATSVVAPASALPLRNVRRFMMFSLPSIAKLVGAGQQPSAAKSALIIANLEVRVEALPCAHRLNRFRSRDHREWTGCETAISLRDNWP